MKKHSKMLSNLKRHLKNMSEEEKEEFRKHFKDETPKGWLRYPAVM